MSTGTAPSIAQSYRGKRIAVIGLGIEGQDLARFFALNGAHVTVSDAKPAAALERQLAAIADLNVRLSLDGNRAELADEADLVAVTQGASLGLPPIVRARQRHIPITSRTRLFLELCPGPVVGISGSSGKTTTTSLTGAIFATAGRSTFVGGNIGGPLLTRLGEIDDQTWVILEVSHTQLQLMDRSPHVACLTNVTPNHLDQFTWSEYLELKRSLLAHQSSEDSAVLNLDNDVTRALAEDAPGNVLFFSLGGELPANGAYLRDGRVYMRVDGVDREAMAAEQVPLRGRHNLENVVCATAIASACGIDPAAVGEAVTRFGAVPHRLELVGKINEVSYFNDSIATAPERTLAGMRSFDEPLVLLVGGREKRLPLEDLAAEAAKRCRAVICFGEAGALLARACTKADERGACGPFIRCVQTLEQAVLLAGQVARAGDVVLLSPACTSFDAYENFERRGEEFRFLVNALTRPQEPASNSELGRQGAGSSQRQ
ncbi:MAG TPA: UDP-N-acetylmuramoyl-L-alanine--D-glutamate ligase [Dehalococcoidia bacterium]|nr:UDP-N-acetylmuramoyl-L-alanine--D-glutamate ligase [Dehalococcoidia bacterium]